MSASKINNVIAAALVASGTSYSSSLSVPATQPFQRANFLCDFTLGNLTNVALTPQVTYDGTRWFDKLPEKQTLTATGMVALECDCAGAKQARVKVVRTGADNTGSNLQVDAVWQSG